MSLKLLYNFFGQKENMSVLLAVSSTANNNDFHTLHFKN